MFSRDLVLVFLMISFLEISNALPLTGWATDMGTVATDVGTVVDTAMDAGVKMPGVMALLSNKSNFLTNLLHYIFGDKIETKLKEIIERHVSSMPESVPIDTVSSDNEDHMTFTKGSIEGINSFEVTPDTKVDITWNWGWTGPTAVMSIYFKRLLIKGEVRKSFDLTLWDVLVDGPVEIRVIENNFVLQFNLHPGLFEWCYLKLTDVICTDMDQLRWDVKDRQGQEDMKAEWLLQDYFLRHESVVEDHIKASVTNMIYHEIPKASPAICDNKNKYLRLSKYQTVKKKKNENGVPIVLFNGSPKPKS